jgi:hypothetical protein
MNKLRTLLYVLQIIEVIACIQIIIKTYYFFKDPPVFKPIENDKLCVLNNPNNIEILGCCDVLGRNIHFYNTAFCKPIYVQLNDQDRICTIMCYGYPSLKRIFPLTDDDVTITNLFQHSVNLTDTQISSYTDDMCTEFEKIPNFLNIAMIIICGYVISYFGDYLDR